MRTLSALLSLALLSAACRPSPGGESATTPPAAAEAAAERPRLPRLDLTDLAGRPVSTARLPKDRPTVLLFFDPDCEHCQAEAAALQPRTAAFARSNFLMVSWAEPAKIRAFMQRYRLDAPVAAYRITPAALAQTFGEIRLPSVYIYDTRQRLVQQFNGQADPDAILAYLQAGRP